VHLSLGSNAPKTPGDEADGNVIDHALPTGSECGQTAGMGGKAQDQSYIKYGQLDDQLAIDTSNE
jgi:hypothetical protein